MADEDRPSVDIIANVRAASAIAMAEEKRAKGKTTGKVSKKEAKDAKVKFRSNFNSSDFSHTKFEQGFTFLSCYSYIPCYVSTCHNCICFFLTFYSLFFYKNRHSNYVPQ